MVPSDVPVCVRVIAVDCLPDETRANRLVVPPSSPPAHARRQALAEARVATAEEGGGSTGPRGAEAHSIDQNKGADAMAAAGHTARALTQGEGLTRINPLL